MSPDAIVIVFLAVMIFCGIVKGLGDLKEHKAITRRKRR